MMMLLAALLSPSAALASSEPVRADDLPVRTSEEAPPPERRVKVSFAGPPLRVELRTAFRDGTGPAPVGELGVQALRLGRFTLDGNLGYHAHANLGFNGLFRTVGSIDAGADGLFELTPWFALGPMAGASFRFYRQQFSDVGSNLVPLVGGRVHVGLVRARRWSVGLSGRVTGDLVRSDLVLDTSEIVTLSPITAEVGLRVQLGHGRDRRRAGRAG
ncbi:MAG: hypothetical protein R3F61_00415 [Myxococcota bacterium]